MLPGQRVDLVGVDAGVDVTLTHPNMHLPPGHFLDVATEEHVGKEEDLFILGNGIDDFHCVTRRAADIGLRLDFRRRVDVADDHGVGMLLFPLPELLRGDGVCEGATRLEVRKEHLFVRTKNRSRFGHEVDAAKDDQIGVGLGRLACQGEGVPCEVGEILNLRDLIVMRKEDRVALFPQPVDLPNELILRHGTGVIAGHGR